MRASSTSMVFLSNGFSVMGFASLIELTMPRCRIKRKRLVAFRPPLEGEGEVRDAIGSQKATSHESFRVSFPFTISDLRQCPEFFDNVADRIWQAWGEASGTPLDTISRRLCENMDASP